MKRGIFSALAIVFGLGLSSMPASARDTCRHPSYHSGHHSFIRHTPDCVFVRDPVYRTLERHDRVRLNNYFDGHRYRSADRWFRADDLRLLGRTSHGTYRVAFRGSIYSATAKWYRGKLCLYLGTAPTRPGYRFELVVG